MHFGHDKILDVAMDAILLMHFNYPRTSRSRFRSCSFPAKELPAKAQSKISSTRVYLALCMLSLPCGTFPTGQAPTDADLLQYLHESCPKGMIGNGTRLEVLAPSRLNPVVGSHVRFVKCRDKM